MPKCETIYGLVLDKESLEAIERIKKSVLGIENYLIYPSGRDIELEIEFSNLNDEVKKLLHNAVG